MLCLKAEALWGEILPVSFPIPRAMQRERRKNRGGRGLHRSSDPSSSSSCEDRCSRCEETKSIHGQKEVDWRGNVCCYRCILEKEVQILEKQLQEEIDLHAALANAVGNTALPSSRFLSKLPNKVQELIASINMLDMTVIKLEEELFTLNFLLQHERRECREAETHIEFLPMPSLEPPSSNSRFIWEEHLTSLKVSKFGGQVPPSIQLDILPSIQDLTSVRGPSKNIFVNEGLGPSNGQEEKKLIDSSLQLPVSELKYFKLKNFVQLPNKLSEEMVACMINIFLRLSRSPKSSSKASLSEFLSSPSSPAANLSCSSLASFSDSSRLPPSIQTSSEFIHSFEIMDQEYACDPYGVNERLNWRYIGKYSFANEVYWMSVGDAQLEYASEALKKFRFLVEQLAKVNPVQMNNDEKLAFWINIYNALIMHAYLAYGIPSSDIKLFTLMQKACYTVGGQSFSAADIEFVILKMKPPAHHPQIALALALNKFKMLKEHIKYSIDSTEPLTLFALSCGMYSCPAVRIFTADKVQEELKKSMEDYIQASVGINDKGKLLVPKLLYFFSKGVVEDSLLVDWICRYLTPNQAEVVRNSTSLRKQRLLVERSFSITPFDSRFRYLFLPHNNSLHFPA